MGRFAVLISLLCASLSASATVATKDMDCTSETLSLHYKGPMSAGGDYVIESLRTQGSTPKMQVTARTSDTEIYGREKGTGEDALFTILSSKNTSQVTRESDCNFEVTSWRSETIVRFDEVNAFARQQLGLQEGAVVKFTCDEATRFPTSSHCD